jgi:altronate dehydratase
MFSHKTMKPDQDVLVSIYKAWKDAVDQIADVDGLYPTFVTNVAPAGAQRVALTNGVGNVWGLEAEPYIRMLAGEKLFGEISANQEFSMAIQYRLGFGAR